MQKAVTFPTTFFLKYFDLFSKVVLDEELKLFPFVSFKVNNLQKTVVVERQFNQHYSVSAITADSLGPSRARGLPPNF